MRTYSVLLLVACALAANQAPPYDNAWCWEGRACTDNTQCQQSNGVNGACCLGQCRKLKLSRGELCGASLPNAACPSCDNNLKCADAGNGQNKCEQQNLANGCLCNSTSSGCLSTQPCLPSGYCGAKNIAPGGKCEISAQCYTRSICNVTCQPIQDGDGCDTPGLSNLCLPGSICSAGSKCMVVAQYNQACAADYECAQPDLWCSKSKCANRTALGAVCMSTSSCTTDNLCNSGMCVAPRSVADNSNCTMDDACLSGVCTGGKCTPTHFVSAGGACTTDLDCPFGASCSNKICTPSGLGIPCNPTLGGGDMAKQCQGSNDLYCSCSGICLATDAAILPQGSATSDCQAAKDMLRKLKFDDLKKIDVSSLTSDQRTAIATDQCCRNCNKDDRLSQVGVSVDCATKTITQPSADVCNLFGPDPLALLNCPARSANSGHLLSPMFGLCVLLFSFLA